MGKVSVLKSCKFSLTNANAIQPVDKKDLDAMRKQLALKALNYDKMNKGQYQTFICEYLSYITGRYGLHDMRFIYDSSQYRFSGETYQGENLVYYGNYIIKKPSSPQAFIDGLNTLEHEIAHNIQFQLKPYDFKKFENEQGMIITIPVSSALNFLACNSKQRVKNQINIISDALYYNEPEEQYARRQAIFGVQEFITEMKNVAKSNHLLNEKNKRNLAIYDDCIKKTIKREHFFSSFIKKYLAPNSTALKITRETIEIFLTALYKNRIKISGGDLSDFTFLFASPTLTTQSQRDRFFKHCYTKAIKSEDECETADYFTNLAALSTFPANKNSKFQIEAIFAGANFVDKKKQSTLVYELYDCFKVDFVESCVLNTVPTNFIDSIFHKYHTDEEFREFKGQEEENEQKAKELLEKMEM